MATTAATDEKASDVSLASKRAKWEAFEYAVPCDGKVNIANVSYGSENAKDHTYTVTVKSGTPTRCTCKADEYQPGPCKHRHAVNQQPAVLMAATSDYEPDTSEEIQAMWAPYSVEAGIGLPPEER